MKLNKKVAAALLAFPLLLGSFSTVAGHHKKNPPPKIQHVIPMKALLKGIDLTVEQKNQLDALRKATREKRRAHREAEKAQRLALQKASGAIITAPTFNEANALKLAQAMATNQVKAQVENLRNQQKIFSLLSPEQQAKVKVNIENFEGKMKGKKDKMQGKGKGKEQSQGNEKAQEKTQE